MGVLKRSLLEGVRKPVRYIVLFLLFTIIFTGIFVGLNIYSSADIAKNNALDKIGGYILYETKDTGESPGQWITEDVKDQIRPIKHVKGLNQNIADYAFPMNFENVKDYTGETPDADSSLYEADYDSLRPYSVIMDSNTDCELIDDFRTGKSSIVEGAFPSDRYPGVMTEERLSKQNNLTVGDTITFGSAAGNEVEAQITGVYRTKGSFEITKDNSIGEAIFAMSPYNRCYTSLNIGASLYGISPESRSLYIYVDQPQNVEEVGGRIKSLDLNWDDYNLVNMTATQYSIEGTQIEIMLNYASTILLYVMLIGAILVSLVLSVYARYYVYDAGIFIALGESKKRILLQFAITVTTVVLLAFIISEIISGVIAGEVTDAVINRTTTMKIDIASFLSGYEASYDVQTQELRLKDYAYFVGITILFILFSCSLLAAEIIRYRPRAILTNRKGR
jgi:putative ABC transport system permease protein